MDRALHSAARMYADDQAAKALGISIDEVTPGRATARMRVTGDMTNGHGIAHGGYIFLLADTAFAYACNSHGPVTVAQGCQISFLGRRVRATSSSRRPRSECGRNATASMTSASAALMGRCWPSCEVTAGRCGRTPPARTRLPDTCANGLRAPAGSGRAQSRRHLAGCPQPSYRAPPCRRSGGSGRSARDPGRCHAAPARRPAQCRPCPSRSLAPAGAADPALARRETDHHLHGSHRRDPAAPKPHIAIRAPERPRSGLATGSRWHLADGEHGGDQVVQRARQVVPGGQHNLLIGREDGRPGPPEPGGRAAGQPGRAR